MLTRPSQNTSLENDHVVLSPVLLPDDLHELYTAACVQTNGCDLFQYHANVQTMNILETFKEYLQAKINAPSEVIFKIYSKRLQQKVGAVSLMNIRPEHGVLEVGSLWLTLSAQRTEINTNAMFLIFEYVFEHLKYRRIEWKCNNLNTVSKICALRLGFEYEGLFRQHMISRGENRDTAWYSMIDKDWPEKKSLLRHMSASRASIIT